MTTYGTPRQAGATAVAGLGVELVVALVGAGFDLVTGTGLRRGFAVGLVLGAVLAALLVRRRAAYPVIVAPPMIYMVIQVVFTLSTGAPMGSTTQLVAQLSNWLVNGFPEMAAATALALVITLAKVLTHR